MSESSPLAGLTGDQADEAIKRLSAVVKEREESLKAAKEHLADMKRARKNLQQPEPVDAQNNGVVAQAQSAEITTEVKNLGGEE